MKKTLFIFLVMTMVFSLASINLAYGTEYQLVGRELFPGVLQPDDIYHGALFLGKIFDETSEEVGYFSVILNRRDENVEICEETTEIVKFKVFMNFKDRENGRLVLVMNLYPDDQPIAFWGYDDPDCTDGCLFYGYSDFLDWLPGPGVPNCNDDDFSLIASVGPFHLKKQMWGSWGDVAEDIGPSTDIRIGGWLVHIPWIPMVFGTVAIGEE